MGLDKKDEEILDNIAANKRVMDNMLRYWPMITLILGVTGTALYNTAVWAFDVEREIRTTSKTVIINKEAINKDLSTHKELAASKLGEFNKIKDNVSELKADSRILKSQVLDIKDTQNTTNKLLEDLARTLSAQQAQPVQRIQQPVYQQPQYNSYRQQYIQRMPVYQQPNYYGQ